MLSEQNDTMADLKEGQVYQKEDIEEMMKQQKKI
jgi:hypothetical protein